MRTATAGRRTLALRIEQISYQELLQYEPLYDREKLPLRFEIDEDADWEYLDYRFYVAYADDGPAGFSGMARTRRDPDGGPTSVYHRSSYTLPKYRQQGVWTALWAHKLPEVARLGWATEATEIWGLTRADDLRYQRRGFRLEGTVVHQYKGERECFQIWTARWARVLRHPSTRAGLDKDVLLHA